jgi:hypothetical protein
MRRTLIGKQGISFEFPLLYKMFRWNVYDVGSLTAQPTLDRKKNLNYQIVGRPLEKILVRVNLDSEGRLMQTCYYYLGINTDSELAYLLTKSLLQRLSQEYPISHRHSIIEFNF